MQTHRDDGLDAETVDLIDFANATFDRLGTKEYIRAFVDSEARQLRLYRRVGGEPGDSEFVRAILDGVKVRIYTDRFDDPDAINLHDREAQTVVTLLKLLAKERSPATVTVEYWEESGMDMLKGSRFGEEQLHLAYRTESGVYHHVQIASVYESEIQMLARHD